MLVGTYDNLAVLGRVRISVGQAPAAQGSGPRFAPDKTAYAPFEPIHVTWSGITMKSGWMGIVTPGAPVRNLSEIQQQKPFVNNDGSLSDGSASFDGFLPGKYEVVLVGGSYDKPYVYKRVPISVQE